MSTRTRFAIVITAAQEVRVVVSSA